MEQAIKIKSEKWMSQIGIPIIILSIVFMLIGIVLGELSVHYLLACLMTFMALLHLVFTATTRNLNYLIAVAFYLFTALTFFSMRHFPGTILVCAILAGISFAGFMYILFTNKIKWRYREVLELAARSVTETANGFTSRPYPAGRADFTPQQIHDFARFLGKHAVVYPIFEAKRVVLVVPSNLLLYLLGFRRNYAADSFIVFNFDGNVSVKLANEDYQKYTEQLTFDQLCEAFGDLFKHFLGQFQAGKKQAIIEQMNQLKFIV